MYNDAVQTSIDSIGILQHQQDIFMQTTDAKLQTLKTTWQDVYGSLINKDELDSGIEALTNLIQVVDNFIDSFGGGIKTIGAFGAIVANVFNKQISASITNATLNQQKYAQNVTLLEDKLKSINIGSAAVGEGASPTQVAMQQQLETELNYARQIQQVRAGINSEQYNELTLLQQQMGQLEYEATLTEQTALAEAKKVQGIDETRIAEFSYLQDLSEEVENRKDSVELTETLTKGINDELKSSKDLLNTTAEQTGLYEQLIGLRENLLNVDGQRAEAESQVSQETLKELDAVIDLLDTQDDIFSSNENIRKVKARILKLTQDINKEEHQGVEVAQQRANAVENYQNAQQQGDAMRRQGGQVEQEFDQTMKYAKQAVDIGAQVTVITSSLSSMAMAWSTVNSMFQTWNDENANLGDQITQTLMSVGIAIPMVISSFSKLNEALGITSSITDTLRAGEELFNAVQDKTISKQLIKNILLKSENLEENKEILIQTTINRLEEKYAALKGIEIAEISSSMKARIAERAVKEADNIITEKAITLQKLWNASLLGNPITLVVAALAALAAAISFVISVQQKAIEKQIELSKATIEAENKVQEEINTNNKLYQSYINIVSSQDETTESKEKLSKAAEDLIGLLKEEDVVVANLTGDYESLTKKVLEAQKVAAQKGLESAEKERGAAETQMIGSARQKRGYLSTNGTYNLTLDSGFAVESGDAKALEILSEIEDISSSLIQQYDEYGNATYTTGINFNINGDNPEELVKLYDELISARDKMNSDDIMSTTERSTSEVYDQIDVWITKMQESVEAYKASLKDIETYQAELASYEIDFNNIDNYDEYLEKRKQLEDTLLEKSETFASKTASEQKDAIDTILSDEYGEAISEFNNLFNIAEAYVSKFAEDPNDNIEAIRDKVNNVLENVSSEELSIIATLDISEDDFYNHLDEVIAETQRKLKEQTLEVRIETIKTAQNEINEGELTDKTYSTLKTENPEVDWEEFDLSSPIQQLETLSELQRQNNQDLLDNYDANVKLIEEEEKRKEKVQELQDEYKRLQNEIDNFDSHLNLDPDDQEQLAETQDEIEKIKEELEGLQGYEVDIEVNLETTALDIFSNAVGDILSKAEGLKTAAELIGEGFIVAKSDAEEFAKIYPTLLENAQVLADGQIQLDAGVVQTIMNGNSAVLKSDAEKTDGILQNKITQLDAEIEYYETVIANLQGILNETTTTEEAKQNINKAAAEYESTLTENLTNDQINAFNKEIEGSKTSTDYALMNLDEIGKRIAAVSEAYSHMLTGEQVTYNPGGATGQSGNVAGYASTFNVEDYSGTQSDVKNQLADAENKLKNLQETRAKYTALLSELRSGTDESFNAMGGAAAGTGGKSSTGSGGSGSGGSSSKEKDPDLMDYLEDESDRYHDINLELEDLETNLDRLDKQQEKLYGEDLIDNLNEQLEILEKQKTAYQEKLAIARQEQAELKASLAAQGTTFDSEGYISNYESALQAKLDYVNTVIAQYNAMSAEEQEAFKDTVEAAKQEYENFKDDISNYDELISSTIPDIEDEIQDAIDKEIEINISKFTMEVELRLDMAEAERDFNEFKRKVIDGIKDDDILGNAISKLADYSSYFNTNDSGTGVIQALTRQVEDTMDQIDQIDEDGWADVYGNNKDQAMEDLNTYYEELMSQLEDVVDLVDEIKDSYLDMIDEAVDAFDKQVDQYEYIKDLLDHDMNVIGLVYGDKAYAQMEQYYSKIEQNNNQELDFLKKRVAYAEEMMNAETDPEAKEKWEEEWMDALSELNEKVEDSIQNIIDKYTNTINKVFEELNDKVTGGLGLDYVSDEWDLINTNADQYLDTINAMYAVQELENKYLDALNNTDSVYAQQKLNDLMNEQLSYLQEKDKLTQYDVDRANLLYEIALKEIALQEAQQNKSKMRLRRDSQGNYSYQFVADEDSIADAQQELLAAQNDLYNFDKDAYKDNLDEIYSYYVEFQEKYSEIMADMSLTDEEKQERALLLTEQYGELINGLVEQNENIKQNLYDSTFVALEGLYAADAESFQEMTGQDIEAFRNLTNTEKDLIIEDLIPQWDSGVQHMADTFAGEGGLIPTCTDAFEELDQATKDYQDSLDELESAAGVDFDSMAEGYDENIEKAQDLLYANDDLINKYMEEIDAILDVIAQLDELIAQYQAAQAAAEAATAAAYAFVQAQREAAASAAEDEDYDYDYDLEDDLSSSYSGPGPSSLAIQAAASPNSSQSSSSSDSGGDGVPRVGDVVTYTGGLYYYDSYGTEPTGSRGAGKKVTITSLNPDAPYPIHVQSSDSAYGWLKKSQITGYDTGGYTGDWGDDSGRLAVLHQKELVLKDSDTANILAAVGLVRDIDSLLENLNLNVMSRIMDLSSGFNIPMSGISASDTLEQDVHIEANFPNVQSSHEIEDALNNLVNIASQRANRKQR